MSLKRERIGLSVAPFETSFSVQLWKSYADQFSILLTAPDGRSLGPIEERLGPQRLENGNTRILICADPVPTAGLRRFTLILFL